MSTQHFEAMPLEWMRLFRQTICPIGLLVSSLPFPQNLSRQFSWLGRRGGAGSQNCGPIRRIAKLRSYLMAGKVIEVLHEGVEPLDTSVNRKRKIKESQGLE